MCVSRAYSLTQFMQKVSEYRPAGIWMSYQILEQSCTPVTGLFLSNENTIGPAVGLLSLVLREASEEWSGQEIIVEGQIGTKGSPFNQVYS